MSEKLTQAGHKISETLERAGDSLKESMGMSNVASDTAKEKMHEAQHRGSETQQMGENIVGTGNTQGNLGRMTGTGTGAGATGTGMGATTGTGMGTTTTSSGTHSGLGSSVSESLDPRRSS